jgi:hypothetical protein
MCGVSKENARFTEELQKGFGVTQILVKYGATEYFNFNSIFLLTGFLIDSKWNKLTFSVKINRGINSTR